jgi:hypothetical protein
LEILNILWQPQALHFDPTPKMAAQGVDLVTSRIASKHFYLNTVCFLVLFSMHPGKRRP